MNQLPNNFPNFNSNSNSNQLPTEWEEIESFSPDRKERIKAVKKQAGILFFSLLAVGLILGVAVSIGVVKILNWSGLTQAPQPTLQK